MERQQRVAVEVRHGRAGHEHVRGSRQRFATRGVEAAVGVVEVEDVSIVHKS